MVHLRFCIDSSSNDSVCLQRSLGRSSVTLFPGIPLPCPHPLNLSPVLPFAYALFLFSLQLKHNFDALDTRISNLEQVIPTINTTPHQVTFLHLFFKFGFSSAVYSILFAASSSYDLCGCDFSRICFTSCLSSSNFTPCLQVCQ